MIVRKRSTGDEIYTIGKYLKGKVKYGVSDTALRAILVDRGLTSDMAYSDADKDVLRLCYADVLKWYILGASKVNNTSDTDNGWTHSGGGYELSDEDIASLKSEANAIYKELEPTSEMKRRSAFRMQSHGVRRADTDIYGTELPHVNR